MKVEFMMEIESLNKIKTEKKVEMKTLASQKKAETYTLLKENIKSQNTDDISHYYTYKRLKTSIYIKENMYYICLLGFELPH